jgi:hypothetical protein
MAHYSLFAKRKIPPPSSMNVPKPAEIQPSLRSWESCWLTDRVTLPPLPKVSQVSPACIVWPPQSTVVSLMELIPNTISAAPKINASSACQRFTALPPLETEPDCQASTESSAAFLSCDHGFAGAFQHVFTGTGPGRRPRGRSSSQGLEAAKALISTQLLEQPEVPGR